MACYINQITCNEKGYNFLLAIDLEHAHTLIRQYPFNTTTISFAFHLEMKVIGCYYAKIINRKVLYS